MAAGVQTYATPLAPPRRAGEAREAAGGIEGAEGGGDGGARAGDGHVLPRGRVLVLDAGDAAGGGARIGIGGSGERMGIA